MSLLRARAARPPALQRVLRRATDEVLHASLVSQRVPAEMLGSRQDDQILDPVVGLAPVAVVNMLRAQKPTTEFALHNDPVLHHVAGLRRIGMIRRVQVHVACASLAAAALPSRRSLAPLKKRSPVLQLMPVEKAGVLHAGEVARKAIAGERLRGQWSPATALAQGR